MQKGGLGTTALSSVYAPVCPRVLQIRLDRDDDCTILILLAYLCARLALVVERFISSAVRFLFFVNLTHSSPF